MRRPGGTSPGSGQTWIHGSRWDLTAKALVDGNVDWPSARIRSRRSGTRRRITGNGLPRHTTGVYPIQQSDDAYQFDRNPNRISSQAVSVSVPAKPKRGRRARCTSGEPVGYLDTGAAIFNALDAGGKDAPAHEVQNRCDGHPEMSGAYHFTRFPAA